MTQFLLSESSVSFTQLAIEYIVYAAIIVIGILLLFALRRCGRLPKHAELAKKLTDFESELRAFQSSDKHLSGYRYFRNISKLIKRADKLLFYSAQMADRERDSDLGSASLGQAAAVELATIALLANIVREMLSLFGTPLFSKWGGRVAPISVAGINSMDVCLPLIARYSGSEFVPQAILHGIALEVSVPLLIGAFC